MVLRLFSVLVGVWLLLAQSAAAEPIRVFAAASLTTALEEIAQDFTERTGQVVTISAAGSSALARQIAAGAPADIFISANLAWMEDLAARDLIAGDTRFDLAGNGLVLIAPSFAQPPAVTHDTLAEVIGADRLALALVDAVPAGIYAKAALTQLGLWEQLAPNVVQADNVRAALALVALGAAPYGIVYASDAVAEARVQVLLRLSPDLHPPITYPAAALRHAPNPDGARAFLYHLRSDAARKVLTTQGFSEGAR